MRKRLNFSMALGLMAGASMLLSACGADSTATTIPPVATATTAMVATAMPAMTDTAMPMMTDTAMPMMTDTAMPAMTATSMPVMMTPTAMATMMATAMSTPMATGTMMMSTPMATGTAMMGTPMAMSSPIAGASLKVGLVTDVGTITDKSFNQGSWEGVELAGTQLGFTPKYIETKDPKDYQANIEQEISDGANVIVTVGFGLADATAAEAKMHPEIKFIGVDQAQDPTAIISNVSGVVFEEDKAGFLAGALAAQMTKTNNVGSVLGTDVVPAVWRYGEGFRAGAMSVNPSITIQIVYHSDVDFSKTFNDPAWGKTTAESMIDKGADVIFGAGGNTGNGALDACVDRKVACIGVDVDQYNTLPAVAPSLLTSATKDLTKGVAADIATITTGTFAGGNYVGVVGLAPYHDYDSVVPQTVKDNITKLTADLASGAVKTGVSASKPAQ